MAMPSNAIPAQTLIDMEPIFVFLIVFLAVFVQTFIGFGSAMIAMGLLASVIGLQIATPLFALIATFFEVILVIYYRESLQIKAVSRITLATLLGIPAGLVILSRIPEGITLGFLGLGILGYAIYSLKKIDPPKMTHPAWAYILGFLAGTLGGAYNITGPPIIIYGSSQQWPPKTFKANLQGYFVITTLALILSHLLAGNYTPAVMQFVGPGLTGAGAGVAAGILLEKWITPEFFKKAVLWMLLVLGLRLIFG